MTPVSLSLDLNRRIRRLILTAACFSLALPVALAQANLPSAPAPPTGPDAKPLAFDVISIKPNKVDTHSTGRFLNGEAVIYSGSVMRFTPDGFTASNLNAKMLISSAYGIKDDLISGGPDWISSTGYNIEAKVAGFGPTDSHQLTKDQRNQMLQLLLADRFKLVAHNETKDAPIYELTIAKGGPRFHEAKPGDTYPNGPKGPDGVSHPGMVTMNGPGQYTGQAMSIASLADLLSRQLHRQIVDKTGLTGKYDISLQWTPDESATTNTTDILGPYLFTALQEQLGLKLDSAKGPVKTLVIDHIEPPSEN